MSAGLIFAVHPIHTERVSNITGSFDLLGIVFILASFYAYLLFSDYSKKKFFYASIILFIIALFSSEEAFILPILVIAHAFIYKKTPLNSLVKSRLMIFPAILLSFTAFRYFIIGLGARSQQYIAGSFFTTMLTMVKVWAYYLFILFVPVNLTIYREVSPVNSFFEIGFLVSFAFLLAIAFVFFRFYRQFKLISFAIAWFFICLLPFSNILPLQTFMAERYLYLSSAGFALLSAYFISLLKKRQALIALAVIVIIFSSLAFARNMDWENDISLFESAAKESQTTSVSYSNLGYAYQKAGLLGEAEASLIASLILDGNNSKAHYTLGQVKLEQGEYFDAANSFLEAIELDSGYYLAYDGLGLAYYGAAIASASPAYLNQARSAFEKSIEINPQYSKAYSDLALIYGQSGNFTRAISLLNTAIELSPQNHEAYYNRGIIYEFLQDSRAVSDFRKAYELNPSEKYRVRYLQYR